MRPPHSRMFDREEASPRSIGKTNLPSRGSIGTHRQPRAAYRYQPDSRPRIIPPQNHRLHWLLWPVRRFGLLAHHTRTAEVFSISNDLSPKEISPQGLKSPGLSKMSLPVNSFENLGL